MYNREDVIEYAVDGIEHNYFDEYNNNNITDKIIKSSINYAIGIIEIQIENQYYYIEDIPQSVKNNIKKLKQLKIDNLIIDIRKEINKNKRTRKLKIANWKTDTKYEKKCPKCGKDIMHRGSGYFDTDFKCADCGTEFNSNLNVLTSRKEWGSETGENFY